MLSTWQNAFLKAGIRLARNGGVGSKGKPWWIASSLLGLLAIGAIYALAAPVPSATTSTVVPEETSVTGPAINAPDVTEVGRVQIGDRSLPILRVPAHDGQPEKYYVWPLLAPMVDPTRRRDGSTSSPGRGSNRPATPASLS